MNSSCYRTTSGYVISELLLSLVLASIVLTPLVLGIHNSAELLSRTISYRHDTYALITTKANLRGVMEGLDTHRFAISPVIHRRGIIKYTDGTLNPITAVAAGLRSPAPNSDAITALALDLSKSYRVLEAVWLGTTFSFTACAQFLELGSTDGEMSYLGVHDHGFLEFVGSVRRHTRQERCRMFILRHAKSMSIPSQEVDSAKYIGLLIPIIAQHTLYIDMSGQLRYLSHRGELNIENQPLVRGVEKMTLALELVQFGNILNLSGEVAATGGRVEPISFVHRLGRAPVYNLLLNNWR